MPIDVRNLAGFEPFHDDVGLLWGIKTVRYPETLGPGAYSFVCENGEQRMFESHYPADAPDLDNAERRKFLGLATRTHPPQDC